MPLFEIVLFNRGAVRVIPLPSSGVVGIGRDPEQAVRVEDDSVSRHHATLTIDGDTIVVEDDDSANGTVLVRGGGVGTNDAIASSGATTGTKSIFVHEPTEVAVGDSITLGAAVLVLRHARAADASPMASLDRLVTQIAPSPIRVLLLGETGVGKEVLAERIHGQSSRAAGPLVRVHCGALAETLLESELFGHEKGAFTGAVRARIGWIEAAHGGTLFLDEVGEMSAALQVKLLRVLEDGKVQPVGSNDARPVDVRVISATHRELTKEVKAGRFRQDLYFRINGITLRIPPLRERRGEIAPLATELLARAAREAKRDVPSIDATALARLHEHAWPGNIRELRQVMERALALTPGDVLTNDSIVLDDAPQSSSFGDADGAATLRDDLEALERRRIEDALERCAGNQSRAAEMLGMPRRTLVERLRAWGMTRPRARPMR